MNEQLFYWFEDLIGRSALGDMIIAFIAGPLAYLLVAGLIIFFLRHKDGGRGVRDSVVIFSAAGAAWVLALMLKAVFEEARPFAVIEALVPIVPIGTFDGSGAFPSGHTAFFASIVGSLYFYHRRAAYWLAAVPLGIGFARVAAGVHWPIDIVGGYLLGLAVGFGTYALYHVRTRPASGRGSKGAL